MATCSSSLSQAAVATGYTTESVKSAYSVIRLDCRHGVHMPITNVVAKMLHGKVTVDQAAALLMGPAPKQER